MAEIEEYVRLNIPETFGVLTDAAKGNLPDLVSTLVSSTLSHLDLTVAEIDALGAKAEFVKSYIGDLITRLIIPTGIDYWQVQSRKEDRTTLPTGFEPGGGESSVFYDRVRGLQDIDQILSARIALNASAFSQALTQNTDEPITSQFGVSSSKDEHLAPDPFTYFDGPGGSGVVVTGFGVPIVIKEG